MEPILQYPNTQKSYSVFIDTSHFAFSGVVNQTVDGPGDLRPIAYISVLFSDTLNSNVNHAEQKWDVTGKKLALQSHHSNKIHSTLQLYLPMVFYRSNSMFMAGNMTLF